MDSRDYYRQLNNENLIPEMEGHRYFTPDQMIWFAEKYHQEQLKPKEDFANVIPVVKCNHNKKNLDYMRWHNFAEEETKKGNKQTQCKYCKSWLFPCEQ